MNKILKQPIMITVLIGLAPLGLAGIYLYGWRALVIYAVVFAVGWLSEMLMAKYFNMKVTSSVFVSSAIFALSLPPTIPLWIAAVGIAFGIVFGKMVFGGFGKNVFNPAITGRAFIYTSFGVPMTGRFIPTAVEAGGWFPAGFGRYLPRVDSVGSATPLVQQASGEASVSLGDLFLGIVPGSIGEASALLVLIGGIYIVWKKAANWRLVVSSLASFIILQSIFHYSGVTGAISPLRALISGSFLMAAFFIVTDPISSSQSTNGGRWIYGAFFGVLTVLIRVFSNWPEGVTFAILLVNMFAPLLDHIMKEQKQRRKEKAQAGQETPAEQKAQAGQETPAEQKAQAGQDKQDIQKEQGSRNNQAGGQDKQTGAEKGVKA